MATAEKDLEDQLVPRRAAASIVGVHYNTIKKWEDKGLITPLHRVHGEKQIFYRLSELMRVADTRPGLKTSRGRRPGWVTADPDALAFWEHYTELEDELNALRSRAAALETLAEELRDRIKREQDLSKELLKKVPGQ